MGLWLLEMQFLPVAFFGALPHGTGPRLHRGRYEASESLGTLGLAVGLRAILDCELRPKAPATVPWTLRINCKDGDGELQKAMGRVLHRKKVPTSVCRAGLTATGNRRRSLGDVPGFMC